MSFPGSPRVAKAGLVLVDPRSGAVRRIVVLQYNPDRVTRSFQPQRHGGTDVAGAQRLKGPAVETIRFTAQIDAIDQLEARDPVALEAGIQPALAALELLVQPASADLQAQARLAGMGMLEIAPLQQPLALLAWSKERVTPVEVTDLSIEEQAFSPDLNPIRAEATLALKVLSVTDLGFDHRGGAVFLSYLAARERLAGRAPPGTLGQLGLGALP